MKISFNCTDDQQVLHTHEDAGLSDQVPCSKPDISPEAYLNDYRNRMPFHYIEEGSDGYYYWQYGSIMDLVINFVDEIAQSEDIPEAVLDVRINDKSVVDPVAGIAHLGSMALHADSDYYTLQQTDNIIGILSQQIKDLQEGGVASIVDTPENLMPGQLLMWDSEARRLVGSPLVKGDSEKSIILKTSSSDPNFAFHEGVVLLGKGLRSSFPYQFITGFYNKLTPEEVFSVGTGFSNQTRSTAFSISRSGKVKAFNPPVDEDDVVRKEELDTVRAIADKAVVANESIAAGTYPKITYDAKGLVIAGSNLIADDIPELSTSKITEGTFSDDRIASASTWNAKQDALTALQLSAVDSGITSEKVSAYDAYAEAINEKLDKSGGTITGSLIVSKDLIVSGTTSTVDTQNLKVTDKLIYVAKDNIAPLTSPAGLITPKYDGINNGGIVYDNTGTAYVGDITLDSNGNVDVNNSDLQPIATRDTTITDDNIVRWDDTAKKLIDSGKSVRDLSTATNLENGTDDVLIQTTDTNQSFKVMKDGRAKVQSKPIEDNDIIRKIDISSLEKRIAEVSNPNLLINSNFSVNQRGKTSYAGDVYTVDAWRGGHSSSEVLVGENSLALSFSTEVTSGAAAIQQKIDIDPLKLIGKTISISAKISSVVGDLWYFRIIYSNSSGDFINQLSADISASGIVSATGVVPENTASLTFQFATKAGSVSTTDILTVEWTKVELGSVVTQFVPPLVSEELIKCKQSESNEYYDATGLFSSFVVKGRETTDVGWHKAIEIKASNVVASGDAGYSALVLVNGVRGSSSEADMLAGSSIIEIDSRVNGSTKTFYSGFLKLNILDGWLDAKSICAILSEDSTTINVYINIEKQFMQYNFTKLSEGAEGVENVNALTFIDEYYSSSAPSEALYAEILNNSGSLADLFIVGSDTSEVQTWVAKFATMTLKSAFVSSSASFDIVDNNYANIATQPVGLEISATPTATDLNLRAYVLYGNPEVLKRIYISYTPVGTFPMTVDLYYVSGNTGYSSVGIKPLWQVHRNINSSLEFITTNTNISELPADRTNIRVTDLANYGPITRAYSSVRDGADNDIIATYAKQNGVYPNLTAGKSDELTWVSVGDTSTTNNNWYEIATVPVNANSFSSFSIIFLLNGRTTGAQMSAIVEIEGRGTPGVWTYKNFKILCGNLDSTHIAYYEDSDKAIHFYLYAPSTVYTITKLSSQINALHNVTFPLTLYQPEELPAGKIYGANFNYAAYDSYSNYIPDTYAKKSEISNPNLLINPDFSINQRGQESYTGTGYGVDRWCGYQLNEMLCTPRSGYGVKLSAPTTTTGTGAFYRQIFEDSQLSKLAGRTVTVSFKVSANRGTSNIYVRTMANASSVGDTPKIDSGATGIVSKTVTLPSPLTSLEIVFRKGTGTLSVDIDWVKLEIGSTATEFVPPLVEEELLKCQALVTDPVQLLRSNSGAFIGLAAGQYIEKIVFNSNVSAEKITDYLSTLDYDENFQEVQRVLCRLVAIDIQYGSTAVYAMNLNALNSTLGTSGYGIAVIGGLEEGSTVKQVVFVSEYSEANLQLIDSIKDENYTVNYTQAGWTDTNDYLLDTSTNHTVVYTYDNKVGAFVGKDNRFFEVIELLHTSLPIATASDIATIIL